ncbi:MAG: DUF3604 domain-containing protein [Alphaproteobacteria bacterium]|jgi:hypothetical protein|nr:DUF3604 domain-containing protein [Rhodospirillaceae bacterium]MDP6404461.1 DUF3604 domain-containing protein [Alphaproteobacteria bacterium]MDP6621754.1 DUF3604 domain-containing protein [Alphaproteobacteria bacterium]|tara:strand:- start:447 stop:2696 length:2250 start_codon:yes stop_codon:yes gene_type:complete
MATDPTDPIAPELLGHATLEPSGRFEAGSYASFTLTYTAGYYGIDDSGSLRICFRFAADQSRPQFDDPQAPGYTTISASNQAVLEYRYDPKGNVRPWDRTVYIKVVHGFLREGDSITLCFGDQSQGSPGMRLQTFCEETYEFRVLVDPIATYTYQPLPEQPTIAIVPGPAEHWQAVLPTLRRKGEEFRLCLKAEDAWGNPSDQADSRLELRADNIGNLPESVDFEAGRFALEIAGLVAAGTGDCTVEVLQDGQVVAVSNPLRVVEATELLPYWGDLHGQSEETIGSNSARDYFAFARDRAFVDVVGHQGNDFQITRELWAELEVLTAEFNRPGRFVTLPGYEWSGNTGLGGDRNIYFTSEGQQIRRSSHALIEDHSDLDSDCATAGELFVALVADERGALAFAHCGGRYADVALAHDGRVERSMEIHSSWGSFEWLFEDALREGHRIGIVANSDGHKGRPGASYPGASQFGAIGGLTCLMMPELSREAVFQCLRARRHYATTGCRMHLSVTAEFDGGTLYDDDPALGETGSRTATSAAMGDIVAVPEGEVVLRVEAVGSAPIERIEVFNGLDLIETFRPYGPDDLGARIRVMWEGAAYRGRFRQVIWDGRATFPGNRITATRPINFFNRDKTLRQEDGNLVWQALTTGNRGGFDAWLAEPDSGMLVLETAPISFRLALDEVGLEDRVFALDGPLPRHIRVFRLPERNRHRTVAFEWRLSRPHAGDNPLYVRVTQEDGHLAWSSPIYVIK